MSWLSWLRYRPDPQPAEKVLSLPCPLCSAPAGEYCDPWSGAARPVLPPCGLCGDPAACPELCDAAAGLVIVSSEPLAVLHTGRILAATSAGLVPEAGVAAQFAPGQAAHSFTKQDQEART